MYASSFGCRRWNVFRQCGTAPTQGSDFITRGSDCCLLARNQRITAELGGLPCLLWARATLLIGTTTCNLTLLRERAFGTEPA